MAERRINTGTIVSGVAHAVVLLWAAISFAAKPLDVPPVESMPVDIISTSELSQMMTGTRTAPKQEKPKPLVEKKAEPKPAENQTAKVSELPEVNTASAASEPPPEEVKPPEPKAAPREPAPPAEEKKAEKKPEPKQPDAEGLQKAEKKKEEKKEARKLPRRPPVPHRKPPPKPKTVAHRQPQEKSRFNADRIQALLDKREPRRLAAAGDVLNSTAALGASRGTAPRLSQNEIDALRARIQQCWNPPAGQVDAKELTVLVRIQFRPDGSLATDPQLLTHVSPGYQQVAAESALRAIRRCAPYSFMPVAKYEAWKDIEVNFDPRDLFRG